MEIEVGGSSEPRSDFNMGFIRRVFGEYRIEKAPCKGANRGSEGEVEK